MKLIRSLILGMVGFSSAIAAQAAPILFATADVVSDNGVQLSGSSGSHSFIHRLEGYDSDTDQLTEGQLTLQFSGSRPPPWVNGTFEVFVGDIEVFTGNFASSIAIPLSPWLNDMTVSANGSISGLLQRTNAAGTAVFKESVISMSGLREHGSTEVQDSTPVSEPGTMALVALGLAGVAALRRRRMAP